MKQMIVSAFSFEMFKQNDDFFKLFFFAMYQVKIT